MSNTNRTQTDMYNKMFYVVVVAFIHVHTYKYSCNIKIHCGHISTLGATWYLGPLKGLPTMYFYPESYCSCTCICRHHISTLGATWYLGPLKGLPQCIFILSLIVHVHVCIGITFPL